MLLGPQCGFASPETIELRGATTSGSADGSSHLRVCPVGLFVLVPKPSSFHIQVPGRRRAFSSVLLCALWVFSTPADGPHSPALRHLPLTLGGGCPPSPPAVAPHARGHSTTFARSPSVLEPGGKGRRSYLGSHSLSRCVYLCMHVGVLLMTLVSSCCVFRNLLT